MAGYWHGTDQRATLPLQELAWHAGKRHPWNRHVLPAGANLEIDLMWCWHGANMAPVRYYHNADMGLAKFQRGTYMTLSYELIILLNYSIINEKPTLLEIS